MHNYYFEKLCNFVFIKEPWKKNHRKNMKHYINIVSNIDYKSAYQSDF